MQLNKQDLAFYRAMKKILHSSKIEFKGDAVLTAASVFKWYEDLGERIEKSFVGKEVLDPKNIKLPEDKE